LSIVISTKNSVSHSNENAEPEDSVVQGMKLRLKEKFKERLHCSIVPTSD